MIDLLIPTRGRPDRIKKLLNSIEQTVDNKENVSVYLYCDNDDSEDALNYVRKCSCDFYINIKHVIGPRIVLSQCWNELWKISSGDIIMHCADDIYFTSNDWDIKVAEHFKHDFNGDMIMLLYGPDGIQNECLATHSFTSRKASNILGYFVPPYFACDYNDTWLNEIYDKINRKVYDSSICIEHEHFTKYSDKYDETYAYLRNRFSESSIIWDQKTEERQLHANKLLEYINA